MDALSIPARRMRRGPVPPRTNFCSQRARHGGGVGVRALYIAAPCHPVPGQGKRAGRYATLLLLASFLSKLSVHIPANLHRTRLHNARPCVRRLTLWLHARCPQDGQEVFFKIKKTAKLGKVRMLLRRRRWLGSGEIPPVLVARGAGERVRLQLPVEGGCARGTVLRFYRFIALPGGANGEDQASRAAAGR